MENIDPNGNTGREIRVGVRELRGNLTHYLRVVSEGTLILVTSHDTIIAELRPPSPKLRPVRQPGALRGKIEMAEDFDVLPDEILAAMEE
jgi:antitoxin (DNA-binding transcriptional repressor) of toxin-antitoxin stability system